MYPISFSPKGFLRLPKVLYEVSRVNTLLAVLSLLIRFHFNQAAFTNLQNSTFSPDFLLHQAAEQRIEQSSHQGGEHQVGQHQTSS